MVVAVVGPPQSGGTDDRQGPLLLVDGMARAALRPSGEGLGGGRCGVQRGALQYLDRLACVVQR